MPSNIVKVAKTTLIGFADIYQLSKVHLPLHLQSIASNPFLYEKYSPI